VAPAGSKMSFTYGVLWSIRISATCCCLSMIIADKADTAVLLLSLLSLRRTPHSSGLRHMLYVRFWYRRARKYMTICNNTLSILRLFSSSNHSLGLYSFMFMAHCCADGKAVLNVSAFEACLAAKTYCPKRGRSVKTSNWALLL
jgi:hypothetical protein